jgi:hypothetical protein
VFDRQLTHLALLVLLLAGLYAVIGDNALRGQWLGVDTKRWIMCATVVPILHQVYVWFAWRSEEYHQWFSRRFGSRAFPVYGVIFMMLLLSRLLSVLALAIANRGTIGFSSTAGWMLSLSLGIPVVYLFYSVARYFTFRRAMGIDHFDASYRALPLVRQGIFRFSPNAMYVFGFLVLWIPGFVLRSEAALWLALFNHLYIWVHYYTIELPDLRRLYKPSV